MNKKVLRKSLSLLLLIFLLPQFFSCKPAEEKPIEISREKEIALYERTGTPIDIILMLDQSGSMNGTAGSPATDPGNLRVEASKYFIRNLSAVSEYEPYLRVGVVNFGTNAPSEYTNELKQVTSNPNDSNTAQLIESVKSLSLGYTSFIDGLKKSYEQFTKFNTQKENRKPVIVIFTDGEPDDTRHLSLDSYFNEIDSFYKNYLKKINCEIYVIGIDATGQTWNKTITYWKRILSENNVIKIDQMEDLFQKYNELIQKIFYLPTSHPDIMTTNNLGFEVPPYLEKIQFDVFPSTKDIVIEIKDAEGNIVSEKNANVQIQSFPTYTTIVVYNPSPGKWEYTIIKGKGLVKIYKTSIPNKMNLVAPESKQTLGKSFNVIFAFLKSDGSEIEILPEYPLVFSGRIITPLNEITYLDFTKEGKGIYVSSQSFTPEEEGKHTIVLTATGRNGFEIKNEFIINVLKQPFVDVIFPSPNSTIKGFKKDLKIEVRLLYEKQEINPLNYFSTDPNSLIWAQLVRLPDGTKSKYVIPLEMSSTEIGKFEGTLPVKLNQKGKYILKVELSGKMLPSKELFEDTETVTFTVMPSFIDNIFMYKYYILIFVAIIIVLIFIFYERKPRLEGTLTVDNTEYYLRGTKMTIGGKGCNIVINPDSKEKLGYIIARVVKGEEGASKVIEIHHRASPEERGFIVEYLNDGDSIQIEGKIFKYNKF